MNNKKKETAWRIQDSEKLYGIHNWGDGYFSISPAGEVCVSLDTPSGTNSVSLYDIATGLVDRGVSMPVLLRFPDIIKKQISKLNSSFLSQMESLDYKGTYRGVYPIKVNQQYQVVDEMVKSGTAFHQGLEAGSKAELLIALAYIKDPEAFVVCNGYKDAEFIDLALYGLQAGLNVVLVVERSGEIETIINRSRELKIQPNIGIRAKLSSTVGGRWAESAGDHSVFGLTASQIVDALNTLRKEDMLDSLKLLHCHLGSQIPEIRSIRNAVREAARYYVSLFNEGAPMKILNIGGGLAIDYVGSKSNFIFSKNYTLDEYCSDVIDAVMEVADQADVPHPVIMTESGRFLSSFSSMLLFNILDVNRLNDRSLPGKIPEQAHTHINSLMEVYDSIEGKNLQEMYHDAVYYRDEIRSLFLVGEVSLNERALSDILFWNILDKISKSAQSLRFVPEELDAVNHLLTDIYYGNFSLFQSLPDSWAIDQVFPVMPVHRLDTEPDVPAIIADTTCDCDGKINTFIGNYEIRNYLPLHPLENDKDYFIGVFLIGAYQETLGDLHNLFGDTNVVSITMEEDGEIKYHRELHGDSVADVLSYVEYSSRRLTEQFRVLAERAVKEKLITPRQRKDIIMAYEEGIRGYTYFEV